MKQVLLGSAVHETVCFTLSLCTERREKQRKCLWVISRASDDNALILSIPGKIFGLYGVCLNSQIMGLNTVWYKLS